MFPPKVKTYVVEYVVINKALWPSNIAEKISKTENNNIIIHNLCVLKAI